MKLRLWRISSDKTIYQEDLSHLAEQILAVKNGEAEDLITDFKVDIEEVELSNGIDLVVPKGFDKRKFESYLRFLIENKLEDFV